MSVLARLIQEREAWANTHQAEQSRRNRVAVVEFGVVVAVGLLVKVYYHKILAAVMLWFSL